MNALPPKVYAIYFYAPGVDLQSFHNYLMYDTHILGFWNYLPLLYFVKSHLHVTELALRVQNFIGPNQFIVAEVNPLGVNGWLPKPAWDWFTAPPEKKRFPTLAELAGSGS